MGLLDKLWDDIVAGPQPDNGLGRLRKCSSMNAPASSPEAEEAVRRMQERRSSAEFQRSQDGARQVTQNISIVKPRYHRTLSVDCSETPSSPAASSPPSSPSSLTPREKDSLWRTIHSASNKAPKKMESPKYDKAEPRSPTVYDWVVISALDR